MYIRVICKECKHTILKIKAKRYDLVVLSHYGLWKILELKYGVRIGKEKFIKCPKCHRLIRIGDVKEICIRSKKFFERISLVDFD